MSQEEKTMQALNPCSNDEESKILQKVFDDFADGKVWTKRQRNEKDESSGPKNKKQDSVPDDDNLEISTEIQEMWDSITDNNNNKDENPKVVDRAKRKEDNDEIAKLFNVRQRKCKWEKDKAEIAMQVEQVIANLEIAVEDDIELNKQGKPAIHKLTKLPILVGALSKKHHQAEFLDHGVLNLLKNWLEPLPDGSLPNINIRTSVLQILADLSIVLDKQQDCRREQLIKSSLAKVVLFLSKSNEETRLNRRLANDLVNRWGHMIYDKSTRYENMLSQKEREEQEQMLLRRENKTAPQTKATDFDVDVDFFAQPMPKLRPGRVVGRTTVPTAMSMEFVLRPGPKVDKKLEALSKMQVDKGRYESIMKKMKKLKARKTSLQVLKISVDGR